MDVDRTGSLSATKPITAPVAKATLAEIEAVAPALQRRNPRLSALDKPWNPQVCIGC